ncbi:MAG TPA: FUSC family protein [Leeuwenhoekiella sp.]|nr:FUSC family protein [Leeuwenhoekiella sp.]
MNSRQIAQTVSKFTRSTNFLKGLLLTSAAFSAIAICTYLFNVTVGSGAALGVLLVSASDIPGNRKHHLYGMGTALLLALVNFLCIHLSLQAGYIIIPVLAILVFCNAIIAVYGFRASLVSFAGLLALVLSFAHPQTGAVLYHNLLYIFLGGLWYMLLASIFRSYRTHKYSTELIHTCMHHTAEYLKVRVSLYKAQDRKAVFDKLLSLQHTITTDHEDIRNAVMTQRQQSGATGAKRKQLLLLIDLVDMLELATANPVDYEKYDQNGEAYQHVLHAFASVIEKVAEQLELFSLKKRSDRISNDSPLNESLQNAATAIETYKKEHGVLTNPKNLLTLRNLYDYTEKQVQKLISIKRVLRAEGLEDRSVLKKEEQHQFLTHQEYGWSVLRENLSLDSPIFKHAIRLVITVLTGYLLGSIFSIQNAYWIILTIIVIMRPGYVLTKDRSKQRAIGTVIGGVVAVGIVLLTQDKIIYGILIFISMTLAFSLVQQNYKTAAVFITLTLVFVYALLTPDALGVIEYRVIDTLIGAALASISNFFLWPAWENQTIRQQVIDSIDSSQAYIKQIGSLYESNKQSQTVYKLARKKAFLNIANLHAGFQRMAQEPKSHQVKTAELYEVVVNSHTLLSVAASLGTYIQIHHTTQASVHFKNSIGAISNMLLNSKVLLQQEQPVNENNDQLFAKAKLKLNAHYKDLTQERNKQREEGVDEIYPEFREKMKEARVIIDQLDYMYSVSQNLFKALKNYQNT